MARYGKTVKGLETMMMRAMAEAVATGKSTKSWTHYEVKMSSQLHMVEVKLYHYGTLILDVVQGICSGEIKGIGGAYSASDRDAINTALDVLEFDSKYIVKTEKGSLKVVTV